MARARRIKAEREEKRKRWREYYKSHKAQYRKWAAAWRAKRKARARKGVK